MKKYYQLNLKLILNKKGDEMMRIENRSLYHNLINKKVEIYTKPIGVETKERFIGTIVNFYFGKEEFIELDTKELINIKYIELIKIID